MDTFSKSERSTIMRAVKSSNNKSTELLLIQLLKQYKTTGWRRNYKIFGNPDFVFQKKKLAIFVDGCFWHGHDCRNMTPTSNKQYWENKLLKNKQRDALVNQRLLDLNWRVFRIWECDLKKRPVEIIIQLKQFLCLT